MKCLIFFYVLCSLRILDMVAYGVDEVKSVSVTEGDSVTLNTDVTEIQRDDQIVWMSGPEDTRIAQIYKQDIDMFDSNVPFGDRLKMESQTGSLTITNIRTEHSGLYKLQMFRNNGTSYQRFNVNVYAQLPIPAIKNSSNCSSASYCSVVCSVVNVSHVTLSWLKGNSLLSSISVSDPSISLSLPLEVDDQDNNTYSCVINNPIKNQTTHLDISQTCLPCPENSHFTPIIIAALLVIIVFAGGTVIWCRRSKKCMHVNLMLMDRCESSLVNEENST